MHQGDLPFQKQKRRKREETKSDHSKITPRLFLAKRFKMSEDNTKGNTGRATTRITLLEFLFVDPKSDLSHFMRSDIVHVFSASHPYSYVISQGNTNFLTRSKSFRALVDKAYAVCDSDNTGEVGKTELYAGLLWVHCKFAA
jgi:hypothetical protein